MSKTVLFRVDASATMGGGHLSRCRSLATALKKVGFAPYFICAAQAGGSLLPEEMPGAMINAEPGSTDDLLSTADIIQRLSPHFVVIDGYHFDSNYLQHISQLAPLVVIDDENNRGPLFASVVINHTSGIDPVNYAQSGANATLLLGSEYALLSPEFSFTQNNAQQQQGRLLICFGASDVRQRTFPVVRLLGKALGPGAPVDVVCGNLCGQVEEVATTCRDLGYRFFHNAGNMPQLMQQAAMAIAAPGTLLYELACMGVPSVFVVVARNQSQSASYHRQQGWCVVLEEETTAKSIVFAAMALWSDPERRQTMSRLARQQVDGRGVERVAQCLAGKFSDNSPKRFSGVSRHG